MVDPSAVAEWTTEDVCAWLTSFSDLSEYCSSFKNNHIDGAVLLKLSIQELKEDLGISSLGHRKKIMQAISILKNPLPVPVPVPVPVLPLSPTNNNNFQIITIEDTTMEQVMQLSARNPPTIEQIEQFLDSDQIVEIGNANIELNFDIIENGTIRVPSILRVVESLKKYKTKLEKIFSNPEAVQNISNRIYEHVVLLHDVLNKIPSELRAYRKLYTFVNMLKVISEWILRMNRYDGNFSAKLLRAGIQIVLKILEQVIVVLHNSHDILLRINRKISKRIEPVQIKTDLTVNKLAIGAAIAGGIIGIIYFLATGKSSKTNED